MEWNRRGREERGRVRGRGREQVGKRVGEGMHRVRGEQVMPYNHHSLSSMEKSTSPISLLQILYIYLYILASPCGKTTT